MNDSNFRGGLDKNRFSNMKIKIERDLFAPYVNGHTVDTCYKLHGYPPGYQPRSRFQFNTQSNAINQISEQPSITAAVNDNFFKGLDKTQYDQLMAMFASHLSAVDKPDESQVEPVSSHSTGTCLSTSTSHSLISPKNWIIDSGTSKHICSSIEDFMSIRTIRDSVVMLPDHTQIVVNLCDVKLNSHLILKDVFCLSRHSSSIYFQ